MTARGRGYSSSTDWDPVRDEYNSTYDSQYPDDESSGGVQLDHTRLYITNLPRGLSEEGLKSAFSRFGTLEEAFVSKDPQKAYALVRYETSVEAKIAMMKMNKTEPLNLSVYVAHKPRNKKSSSKPTGGRQDRSSSQIHSARECRDHEGSVSSMGRPSTKRVPEDNNNEEQLKEKREDDEVSLDIDRGLHLELETLKLQQLKVKEEQLNCKQRLLMLQQNEKRMGPSTSKRCVLPDGRIMIRTSDKFQDGGDNSLTAGAGDSLVPPALQSFASRQCVVCGARAESFCAACGVTPYCGAVCQRRDWADRHKAVCHNLTRMGLSADAEKPQEAAAITNIIQASAPAPLRRPYSREPHLRDEDSGSDKSRRTIQPHEDRKPNHKQQNNYNRNKVTNGNRQDWKRPNEKNGFEGEEDWGNIPKETRQPNKQQNYSETKSQSAAAKPSIPESNPKVPEPRPKVPEPRQTTTEAKPSNPVAKPNKVIPRNVTEARASSPEVRANAPEPRAKVAQTIANALEARAKAPEARAKVPESRVNDLEVSANIRGTRSNVTQPVKPNVVGVTSPQTVAAVEERVPTNYMVEKLNIGDVFVATVDADTAEGLVCLTLHTDYEDDYSTLVNAYAMACEALDVEPGYKARAGQLFSFLCPVDGGWYRARLLSSSRAALIDAPRTADITPDSVCRRMPEQFKDVPEFSAVVKGPVALGDHLSCTILSKTRDAVKVNICDESTGTEIGVGEITRWTPAVVREAPVRRAVPAAPRPALREARVRLADAGSAARGCVRGAGAAASRAYAAALHDALHAGLEAPPLTEPPQPGDTVIAKFTDGQHYRAFVRRTNVKMNKYLIEYCEFGNEETCPLERLSACPAELTLATSPCVASLVQLTDVTEPLTPAALEYIDYLKYEDVDLLLTIPSGEESVPSGSRVQLTVAKNNESVNKKLEEFCMPEWKKLEMKGGDVLDSEPCMFSDVSYVELPVGHEFELHVTDASALRAGSLCGHARAEPHADIVRGPLARKIAEYCDSALCKEAYLPKMEELCITKNSEGIWCRAALFEMVDGPGSKTVKVLFLDYGNIEEVSVSDIRKMLPEFVDGYPAIAAHCEIIGFPSEPTEAQLRACRAALRQTGAGLRTRVTRCELVEPALYRVRAPELEAAVRAAGESV